ncbi:hypothetical protein P5D95_22625 [Vibrio parahaemolyticus]|nr:hypothetical protein [Vibrio parahaemolyticus]
MIVFNTGSSSMVKPQFQLFQVQSFASVRAVFCSLALTEQSRAIDRLFLVATLPGEFVGSKAELLAEKSSSLVW